MDFLIEFLHDGFYYIIFLIVALLGIFAGAGLRKLKDKSNSKK